MNCFFLQIEVLVSCGKFGDLIWSAFAYLEVITERPVAQHFEAAKALSIEH